MGAVNFWVNFIPIYNDNNHIFKYFYSNINKTHLVNCLVK